MSVTAVRPRLWWRLVLAAALVYLVLLVTNYLMPWLGDRPAVWATAELLIVVLAFVAAVKDLSAVRPLRRAERAALVIVTVLVLLWLAAMTVTWFAEGRRDDVLSLLLGLVVAVPVVPLVLLAVPGMIAFRRTRQG
ncbi:hypothetical protein KOI35_40920 [Actinoplanes bogorensis]|uniref:Uncharacterized protein n=1 Tax=Paractinoplanes bogorensis TaxID=1610840 RepID=A0ABS5Z2L0_9ACTN|nr:hypothetical protein [Actinoplanes bogorensis]MBU2669893.1 hypothetical protein [Actinoplanes bogorensis]